MNKSNNKIMAVIPLILIALLISIDQFLKFVIVSNFKLGEARAVIKDVFEITYIQNRGIAWGMFQGKKLVFIILTLVALVGCAYIYNNIKTKSRFLPLRICLIFLISGAVGNMIDRIKLGYVIDFLYFKLIDFPVFNFADICVTLSMLVIFVLLIFVYSDDEFDEILGVKAEKKKKDK